MLHICKCMTSMIEQNNYTFLRRCQICLCFASAYYIYIIRNCIQHIHIHRMYALGRSSSFPQLAIRRRRHLGKFQIFRIQNVDVTFSTAINISRCIHGCGYSHLSMHSLFFVGNQGSSYLL